MIGQTLDLIHMRLRGDIMAKFQLPKEACDKFYAALIPAAQRIVKERKARQAAELAQSKKVASA